MKRKFSFLLAVFMIFNIVISGFSNNFVSAKSSPKIDTKSSDVVANTADKKQRRVFLRLPRPPEEHQGQSKEKRQIWICQD